MKNLALVAAATLIVGVASVSAANAQRSQNERTMRTESSRGDDGRVMRSGGGSAMRGEDRDQRGGSRERGFCPPGQAKKAGKGSAFQC